MNKIDFTYLNAAIDELQNMKNSTYEDPEIINDEPSLFISPHDIESVVRVNQNDSDRIITNNCPKIPDHASKAETEGYVTYQHFTPEHYEEINNEIDQRKEIEEETVISVITIDSHQQLVFD